MPINSRIEKASNCCRAPLETRGEYENFYDICSQCKKEIINGSMWDFKYFPSDYEIKLEKRIAELERLVNILMNDKIME